MPALEHTLISLDAAWHMIRPDFYRALPRGALLETFERAEKTLGFSLPSDLRTLYAWHDGEGQQRDGVTESSQFGPYYFIESNFSSFWSLERVVTMYNDLNRFPADNAPFWRPGWLPFLSNGSGGDYIAYDLGFHDCATAGRLIVMNHEEPEFTAVMSPSLNFLFEGILQATTRGHYVYTDGGFTMSDDFDDFDGQPDELSRFDEHGVERWNPDLDNH